MAGEESASLSGSRKKLFGIYFSVLIVVAVVILYFTVFAKDDSSTETPVYKEYDYSNTGALDDETGYGTGSTDTPWPDEYNAVSKYTFMLSNQVSAGEPLIMSRIKLTDKDGVDIPIQCDDPCYDPVTVDTEGGMAPAVLLDPFDEDPICNSGEDLDAWTLFRTKEIESLPDGTEKNYVQFITTNDIAPVDLRGSTLVCLTSIAGGCWNIQ